MTASLPLPDLNWYRPFGDQHVTHLTGGQVPRFLLRKNIQTILVAHTPACAPMLTEVKNDNFFPPEIELRFYAPARDALLGSARDAELAFLRNFPGQLARLSVRGACWKIIDYDSVTGYTGTLTISAIQDDPAWVAEFKRRQE